jgi:hypothetical protein
VGAWLVVATAIARSQSSQVLMQVLVQLIPLIWQALQLAQWQQPPEQQGPLEQSSPCAAHGGSQVLPTQFWPEGQQTPAQGACPESQLQLVPLQWA